MGGNSTAWLYDTYGRPQTPGHVGYCLVYGGPPGGDINMTHGSHIAAQAVYMTIVQDLLCPSNAALTGTTCTCNSGFIPNSTATVCVTGGDGPGSPQCVKGRQLDGVSVLSSTVQTTFVCLEGCEAKAQAAATDNAGKIWVWGPIVDSGVPCLPDTPRLGSGEQPKPEPNKPGYCPGTVNGTPVPGGVPCSSTNTGSETKTSSASSPASGASGSSGTGSSGTTTERTETTCKDGICTTTTTTTSNSNGTGSTDTKTEEKDEKSFCDQNPTLAICKDGKWGGSCTGGFTCSGDAVQCAIARATHESQCKFFNPSDALAAEGVSLIGSGGTRPSEHPWNDKREVDFAGGFGGGSNLIGAGSCPADLSVPVPGRPSMTISFAPLCGAAGWLGNLLVGLTALACIGIVFVRGK